MKTGNSEVIIICALNPIFWNSFGCLAGPNSQKKYCPASFHIVKVSRKTPEQFSKWDKGSKWETRTIFDKNDVALHVQAPRDVFYILRFKEKWIM